ncbi:hypothetical protein F5X68DRAFT_233423 [Plectosphaerella plurivora]|uniref:Uncharacterized protein n=1 Tax=Plectosphaerella plurivora TaxID=936078 RepID=A0A9P8V8G3_9PEZI|nr:hypothetical protein F5X68DRAFT_233423 [Plectosphaerella plurivora]
MQTHRALLALFALATVSTAHHGTPGSHLNRARNVIYCSSSDIAHHRVSGCECRPKIETNTCEKQCNTISCTPQLTNVKHVNDCSAGCGLDSDGDCKGCGLWFHSVCGCIKDPKNPKKCLADVPISQGSPNTWIRLINDDPKEHDLITSTSMIPGILDMTGAPSPYFERGWVYGQKQWKAGTEALAMNPWVVRTMEQVHIHICNLNTTLRSVLSQQNPKAGQTTLAPLDTTVHNYQSLWCMASKKDQVVDNLVQLLADRISVEGKKKGGVCPELFGAGMMMDDQKRTWACATTERHGPLGLFCAK